VSLGRTGQDFRDHIDLWQLIGEDLGRSRILDPEHDERVEVAADLLGLGRRADLRLHIRPCLSVNRHLEASATRFVEQWHKFVTD
jgi:hypothetical protein